MYRVLSHPPRLLLPFRPSNVQDLSVSFMHCHLQFVLRLRRSEIHLSACIASLAHHAPPAQIVVDFYWFRGKFHENTFYTWFIYHPYYLVASCSPLAIDLAIIMLSASRSEADVYAEDGMPTSWRPLWFIRAADRESCPLSHATPESSHSCVGLK